MYNLKDLPKDMTLNKYHTIARWILQYRKFSTSAAMKHAPVATTISDSTLKQYFDGGVYYLLSGQKNGGLTAGVVNALDNLRNTISSYTPSKSDERRIMKSRFQKSKLLLPLRR